MTGLAVLIGIYLLAVGLMIGLLFAGYAIFAYNRFIRLATTVKSALSDIDVHLRKRYDLIPNLVQTVKGYAGHEDAVFTEVTGLRSRAMQATTLTERAENEKDLRGLFNSLFAVAENYPQLQADENFRKLQETLRELENNIETARRHYNAVVREHNILLRAFPSNLVARWCGFREEEFFVVGSEEERQLHKVDFTRE